MNTLLRKVKGARGRYPGEFKTVQGCDLLFADDILRALAHGGPQIVTLAAQRTDNAYSRELGFLGLNTTAAKSENVIVAPHEHPASIHRSNMPHSKNEQESRADFMNWARAATAGGSDSWNLYEKIGSWPEEGKKR